jgi:hypothetical protein
MLLSLRTKIKLILAVFMITTLACSNFSLGLKEDPPQTTTDQPPQSEIMTTTEESHPDSNNMPPYWVEMTDQLYGVRFTIPCFWEAQFPEQVYPSGVSYPVVNYPEEYVFTFPRGSGVWENGGIKIDMNYMDVSERNIPPGTSLQGFIDILYQGDLDVLEYTTEEVVINNQPALFVAMDSSYGTSQYYLFTVSDEVYFLFSTQEDAYGNPDVLGILNSIAISEDVVVNTPDFLPGPPPIGLAAPCIPGYEQAIIQTPELLPENTACGVDSFVSLDYLTQSVQQKLFEKNTGSLHWDHFIHDPFVIAYWQSEGIETTPDIAATTFANQLYQAGEHGGLTFTIDRGEFPPLFGMPPEAMFGPDVKVAEIIYSEGWGLDGLGAALLYLFEDECGGYYWHGLVFAGGHFDK